jgi:cyclopropane fatty-acyl-phospholipid synthase-like methyltransferase
MAVIVGKVGSALIGRFISEAAIVAVLKAVGVRIATKTAASYVPMVGSTVAATVSFGMMKTVGNRHVDDCFAVVREFLEQRGKEA